MASDAIVAMAAAVVVINGDPISGFQVGLIFVNPLDNARELCPPMAG